LWWARTVPGGGLRELVLVWLEGCLSHSWIQLQTNFFIIGRRVSWAGITIHFDRKWHNIDCSTLQKVHRFSGDVFNLLFFNIFICASINYFASKITYWMAGNAYCILDLFPHCVSSCITCYVRRCFQFRWMLKCRYTSLTVSL